MKPKEAQSNGAKRSTRHPALVTIGVALAICLATLPLGRPAAAQEFRFNAEPAAAFWLDTPQSDRFGPGFYLALRPGISLGRIVALQWSYALLYTPAAEGFTENGTGHFFMTGVRVRPLANMRPASEQLGGLFVDLDLGYVRTDDFDCFGFDVGLGYGFQATLLFSLGPVVRYGQIFQGDNNANEDPNDGQFLTIGLDFAFGPAHEEEEVVEAAECPTCQECLPEEAVARVATPCSDGDRDGVCDLDDHCPMAIGPPATLGCPIDPCSGDPLIVLVQFDYDSAELPRPRLDDPQTMDPVLDAVAEAVGQDPSCRVCIVGYASEEGPAEHNLDLSRRRAAAVQGYLTARGLNESRMPSTGLGTSCQLVPESTRPLNRRVEFRRLEEGESCPTDCSP